MVQKEGEVKILNSKISSLEKQKVVYATFTFAFSFSAVNLSSVPRHTVIVLNHSGERKKNL